jgi:hypothetical protein
MISLSNKKILFLILIKSVMEDGEGNHQGFFKSESL